MKYISFLKNLNNMKKLLIILCAFLLCFSFSNKYEIPDYEKAVNKQMDNSAKMLSRKYNIRPCATTVAMPGGGIQYLELKFDSLGPIPQDAIRRILINSVQDFLDNVNCDQALCAFLTNGHFGISEVGITLFFSDANRYPIKQPEIGIASIRKGELEYTRCDPNDISINGRTSITETYEEALQLSNSFES
jgi:hypothetical protein